MNWQIQEAKARFSEMVKRTLKEGPQTLTRRGKPIAALVPADQYRRLRSKGKTFKEMLAAALSGDLRIRRAREKVRIVELDNLEARPLNSVARLPLLLPEKYHL